MSSDGFERGVVGAAAERLDELPPETYALVRSMLTVPEAAEAMREYLDERVDNLAGTLTGDDAKLRAALTVSGILGLTVAKHFLTLQAFDDVPDDAVLRAARGWAASVSADPDRPDPRA